MRIYVASSWRNKRQPEIVRILRQAGHEVYDFRHPAPENDGFSWKQCATQEQLKDPKRFRDEVLTHPVADNGFDLDMNALKSAEVTILVLPCGRSAHLELGYAVGAGQNTFVLFDEEIDEPELMYKMCRRIAVSIDEILVQLWKWEKANEDEETYMVSVNPGGSVFVKAFDFFVSQHGFTEPWGLSWVAVQAESIEDARKKGLQGFCRRSASLRVAGKMICGCGQEVEMTQEGPLLE